MVFRFSPSQCALSPCIRLFKPFLASHLPCLIHREVYGFSCKPDPKYSATGLIGSFLLTPTPDLIDIVQSEQGSFKRQSTWYQCPTYSSAKIGHSRVLPALQHLALLWYRCPPIRGFHSNLHAAACWLSFCSSSVLSPPASGICSGGPYDCSIFPPKHLSVCLEEVPCAWMGLHSPPVLKGSSRPLPVLPAVSSASSFLHSPHDAAGCFPCLPAWGLSQDT